MASRIRINFHSDSEAMINKQINMELYASYVYMAMVSKKSSLDKFEYDSKFVIFYLQWTKILTQI